MTESIEQYYQLQTQMEQLIKKQMTLGFFIDWEDWLKDHFNPLNEKYKEAYIKLSNKPQHIDYETKVATIICNDCDMKLYE